MKFIVVFSFLLIATLWFGSAEAAADDDYEPSSEVSIFSNL